MLKEALNSDIDLVKTAAISSLGDLKDARAVELLAPHVSNADWQVRYRTAQALGKLGGTQAQSILEKMANDEAEAVAQEAKTALEQMG